MDFKKLSEQTGTVFNRIVQSVGEKVVSTDITQIDAEVVNSMNRSIQIQKTCERVLASVTALLVPNPALRAENFIRDVFQAKTIKPNNYEALGDAFISCATQYDVDSSIGKVLMETGKHEERIGVAEKEYVEKAMNCFSNPIQKFIDEDCKEAANARQALENARLDYDSARRQVKQALTAASKQSAKDHEDLKLRELDQQSLHTKTICDNLDANFRQLSPHFKNFAKVQVEFFESARNNATELQNKLNEL